MSICPERQSTQKPRVWLICQLLSFAMEASGPQVFSYILVKGDSIAFKFLELHCTHFAFVRQKEMRTNPDMGRGFLYHQANLKFNF